MKFLPLLSLTPVFVAISLTGCKQTPKKNNTTSSAPHIPSDQTPSPNPSAYAPGLGEIMTVTQMRHSKLWFAGKAQNWELATYEISEIKEGFDDAVRYHPKRTILLNEMMAPAFKELEHATQSKDEALFVKAFTDFTASCNRCHQATAFGFNVVQIPKTNPYTNQNFKAE